MEFKTFVLLMMLSSVTKFRAATGAGPALIAPNGHHVEVHYNCEKTGTVTLHIKPNATNKADLFAVSNTTRDFGLKPNATNDTATCHQGLTALVPTVTTDLVLKSCNTGAPLYLYFLKSRSKPYNSSDPVVYGGSEYQMITLDCSVAAGANYTIKETFTDETDKIAKESTENPDIKLDMTIGPKQTTSTKTNIHVGDIVTVNVTDSSDPLHYLAFADCQATDDKPTNTNSIELLQNGHKQQADIIATDPSIPTSAGRATLDMYAFRFAKSTKVRVVCAVKVCKAQCKRKRRSVDDDKLHMLEATYTITDATQTSGQDKAIGSWITMVTLLILTKFL